MLAGDIQLGNLAKYLFGLREAASTEPGPESEKDALNIIPISDSPPKSWFVMLATKPVFAGNSPTRDDPTETFENVPVGHRDSEAKHGQGIMTSLEGGDVTFTLEKSRSPCYFLNVIHTLKDIRSVQEVAHSQ